MTLSTRNLIRQRLVNQLLAASRFRQPVEVVAWFGAMQAQEYASARWALGLRALKRPDKSSWWNCIKTCCVYYLA